VRRDAEAENPDRAERRRRFRRGQISEIIAAGYLLCCGYRILARRYRTPVGEIDLVAVRRRRVSFVEVKRRGDDESAESAIGGRQRRRILRAAEAWIARHPRFIDYERSFDIVFIMPRRWPRHIEGGL